MTLREVRRMFRWFFRRDAVRRALDDEMAAHIDLAAQSYIRQGMSPADARSRAEREFGGRMSTREAVGDVHALPAGMVFDGWLHDVRIAARSLWHSPSFSIAVIAIFTLAIAANATIVGLVDRLLLRPPAGVADADQLARVYVIDPQRRTSEFGTGMSYLRYAELRDASASVIDLAMMSDNPVVIGEGMNAERVSGQLVSANYFDVAGVQPYRGRFFTDAEAAPPTGEDVMIISHGLWQRMYAGSDSAIGQRVRLGSKQYAIIGVAPPDFTGFDLDAVDVWLPATAIRGVFAWLSPNWYREHNFAWTETIGRVKADRSREVAQQALNGAYLTSLNAAKASIPDGFTQGLKLAPVQPERGPNRSEMAKVAGWLAAVSLIMLVIAAANVANLFLTRGINRRRELSVRLALGVTRARLVIQLLSEGILLALVSAVLAAGVTWWTSKLVIALVAPNATPLGLIDVRMMLVTFVAATVAALAGSLLPVFKATRLDLAESLRSGVRAGTYERLGLRSTLLATQAALSVLLLVGAGLFVRSLENARHARIGFNPEGLVLVDFSARGEQIAGGSGALYLQFLDRLRGMPSVEMVSRAMSVPFGAGFQSDFAIPGVDSVFTHGDVHFSSVDPTYFAVLGTRVVDGRLFDSTDVTGAPLVAVVSESMARTFWAGQRAVGQCIRIGGDTLPCSTIIGVVENTHRAGVRPETSHQYYVTSAQTHPNTGISSLVVRVKGDPVQAGAQIRRELQSMSPGAVFVRARHMSDLLAPTLRPWKLGAAAFVVLGALALVIAAMGLASVISNVVAQRRHEFGVRLALGARGADVMRVAVREGLPWIGMGLALGLGASAYATRWIGPLLFGVEPLDAVVFIGVIVALGVTSVLASVIPALRALRLDPLTALRNE
jgi:putative ABC transport system permease protein